LSARPGAASAIGPRFFSEVSGATWNYLGDKLGIPQAEYSIDLASERLADRGADPETITDVRSLLEESDLARFAPTTIDRPAMQRSYDEASRIIVELEKTLRSR
jgi:hypothetical protein